MDSLRERISLQVKPFVDGADGHGTVTGRAFVRLSTRSPKDAVDVVPALRVKLVNMLRQRLSRDDEDDLTFSQFLRDREGNLVPFRLRCVHVCGVAFLQPKQGSNKHWLFGLVV